MAAELVYLNEASDFINAMNRNNENLINALTSSIDNLAMNTGNKTTREYNELKKKYTELENNFKKSDCLFIHSTEFYRLLCIYSCSDRICFCTCLHEMGR